MKNSLLCLRWLLLPFLLSLHSLVIFSQDYDFNSFTALRSSGEIPLDFRQWATEKSLIQQAQIDRQQARWTKRAHKEFIIESNFFINEVLLSGYVLFNDPITDYINKVADELLRDDPVLRQRLRFYALKSPSVNAFATDQGIIFVNIGLLAQLEDEAQLAFVLAHEITHYVKKHTLSLYLERQQMEKGSGRYSRYSYDDKLFTQHHRSRDMENEADEYGLELFTKTNYSLKSVNGVFDVLLYSDLPFDELQFDPSFISNEYFEIPEDYLLNILTPISAAEDYDDTYASHPNIKRRRQRMNNIIAAREEGDRKKFIVGEKDFEAIRNIARFESLNQYMISLDYGNALYNTFVVMKDFPDNPFLDRVFAASLYGLSKYKTRGNLPDVIKRHTRVEGQSQQLYYLIRQLRPTELNALALYHCYRMHLKYPEAEYFKSITQDLMLDLVLRNKMELGDFRRTLPSDTTEIVDPAEASGKYERIRLSKQRSLKNEKIYDVFIDLFTDTDFEMMFLNTLDEKSEEFKIRYEIDIVETPQQKQQRQKEEKKKMKHGYALGKDKIVVVDPVYYIVDQSKKKSLRFIDSEQAMKSYKDNITRNADRIGLNAEMIDTRSFGLEDVNSFNNFSSINEWFFERLRHGNNDLIQYTSVNVPALIDFYQTSVFLWSGALSLKDKNSIGINEVCVAIMMPFYMPFLLYLVLYDTYQTSYYYLVIDLETAQPIMIHSKSFNLGDRGDVTNSIVYDILDQIKRKPKK